MVEPSNFRERDRGTNVRTRDAAYRREEENGYKAATFVEDGDVIAIDDGSTPLQMVPYLVHRKI